MSARLAHVTSIAVTSIAAIALTIAARASAYCPSYTPAETAGGQNCGVSPVNGANPSPASWTTIFAKVAPGQASWGASGPSIDVMGSGCGKPIARHTVAAHFPCHVLQAIAMQESGWRQFCVPDAPSGSVGAPERTIVAFDCGYGVGQVTSGMHVGESPAFDRARVASDPTYNLATGTLILRDKWAATSCVGDNDPDVVEDWYTAIWAYNGLAYSNNPNNPNLDANRGVYDPAKGGSYAYQERVLGWMEHPPGAAYWTALAPAYPNRGDIGATTPADLPEPSCASPTSCAQTRSTHASACGAPPTDHDGGASDAGATDASDDDARAPASDAASAPPVAHGDGSSVPVGAGPQPPNAADAQTASAGGCACDVARSPRDDRAAWLALVTVAIAIARTTSRRGARRSARR